MITFTIPVGNCTLKDIKPICKHFNCKVKYTNELRFEFEITTDDPANIFWLGANWNNEWINSLLKENQELKSKVLSTTGKPQHLEIKNG